MRKNKTMSSETMSNGDRISSLPEPMIHHIMSFLLPKDVTRVGSLSKKWRTLRNTYPILDFDQTRFQQALPNTLSDGEKLNLFLTSLYRSIDRLEQGSMNIYKLKFHALIRLLNSDPILLGLAVKRALECNVQELDLGFYDERKQYRGMPRCLYSAKSVRCLNLMGFKVKIANLISGCPSMEELVLEWCNVSKDVKFSSDKLKKFHVQLEGCRWLKTIELDACNLQSFSYHGYSIENNQIRVASSLTERTCTINVSSCIFLRDLSLKNAQVSDWWLENHIIKLVHLKDLSLDGCHGLSTVRICHENLENLYLLSCTNVLEVEIDCPKLRRFEFKGGMPDFKLLNSSGLMVATLALHKGRTIWWFAVFRRLLGLFDHCKTLKIVCDSYEDFIFPEEVRESFIPPLHDLKHLEIKCKSSRGDYTRLVDNLLWLSPHLEMLFLTLDRKESWLKFQYKKMYEAKDKEDVFWCCKAYPKECWRHCLEKVIIDDCDCSDDKDDAWKNLLDYFCENAKGLESIQDNSRSLKIVEGEYFEQSVVLR